METELAHVELAASHGRRDAEVATLPTGRRTRISGTLAAILGAALRAAEATDGAVDPTTGRALRPVGDVDPWRGVELDEAHQTVLVPRGVELNLDPIARAWAADRCAAVVADVIDVGVLVSLGGDIATAGPAGGGAWEVLVTDDTDDTDDTDHTDRSDHTHHTAQASRAALVAIPTGLAVVTSTSTTSGPYRTATVVAPDCVTAATWSTAALGEDGRARLGERGLPARLVGVDGSLTYLAGWPEDGELTPTGGGC